MFYEEGVSFFKHKTKNSLSLWIGILSKDKSKGFGGYTVEVSTFDDKDWSENMLDKKQVMSSYQLKEVVEKLLKKYE